MGTFFNPERARIKVTGNPLITSPIQRSTTHSGQSLDALTRQEMESRFEQDFSQVRIHSGPHAAEAAAELGANAFTVGSHVVFGAGRFEPHTPRGRRLLAHELAHVVQQATTRPVGDPVAAEPEAQTAAQRVVEGESAQVHESVPPGALQRDNGAEQEEERRPGDRRYQLRTPELGESLGRSEYGLGESSEFRLRLDPQIQAQIRAIQYMRVQLSPENLVSAASDLSGGIPSPDESAAPRIPSPGEAAQAAGQTSPRTGPFSVPPTPQPQPLVPAGRGPETPRPGKVGDVIGAIMRIPAVQAGVDHLQEEGERQLRQGWESLSTGERALVISHGIILGGTALTGLSLSPQARQLALDQLQGRDIPLPGLPVTVRLQLTGPTQEVFIGANIGRLLPPSLGFR